MTVWGRGCLIGASTALHCPPLPPLHSSAQLVAVVPHRQGGAAGGGEDGDLGLDRHGAQRGGGGAHADHQ